MKFRCAAALCALLAAAGCGQKGPLYLPGDPNEGRLVLPDELAGMQEDEDEPAGAARDQGPERGPEDAADDRPEDPSEGLPEDPSEDLSEVLSEDLSEDDEQR